MLALVTDIFRGALYRRKNLGPRGGQHSYRPKIIGSALEAKMAAQIHVAIMNPRLHSNKKEVILTVSCASPALNLDPFGSRLLGRRATVQQVPHIH